MGPRTVPEQSAEMPDPCRILIIDDELMIRKLLDMALNMRGYSVATASDTYEGLQTYRARPADLVMLDYVLPQREGHPNISHRELIDSLREINPAVSIYMMSGYDGPPPDAQPLPDIKGFLKKPFDIGELCGRIDAELKR